MSVCSCSLCSQWLWLWPRWPFVEWRDPSLPRTEYTSWPSSSTGRIHTLPLSTKTFYLVIVSDYFYIRGNRSLFRLICCVEPETNMAYQRYIEERWAMPLIIGSSSVRLRDKLSEAMHWFDVSPSTSSFPFQRSPSYSDHCWSWLHSGLETHLRGSQQPRLRILLHYLLVCLHLWTPIDSSVSLS